MMPRDAKFDYLQTRPIQPTNSNYSHIAKLDKIIQRQIPKKVKAVTKLQLRSPQEKKGQVIHKLSRKRIAQFQEVFGQSLKAKRSSGTEVKA